MTSEGLRLFTTNDDAGCETILVVQGFGNADEIDRFLDKLYEAGVLIPNRKNVQ